MKTRSASLCAFCAAFGLAISALAADTYTWTATGDGVGSSSYVKILDDVGAFNGRLRLVGFSTAEGEYTVTSNRVHELTSASSAIGALPAGSYVYQMSCGARFDGTTTKSIRVQLAQPANSNVLYARITAIATANGDHTAVPDLRVAINDDHTVDGSTSTDAANLLANAVTKIVVGEIGDGTDTYTWTAGETPASLGYGAVRLTYAEGGGITAMTATPLAGRKIVIVGDTISFTDDAKIYMAAGGELVFSNLVYGSANIGVNSTYQEGRTISYSGASIGTQYVTLFANQNLEDWAPLKTGNSGSRGWWNHNPNSDNIPVYNIRRETDGTITAQRQGKVDTHLIGVVKFQLKQSGADIAGRCVYAGYWNDTLGIGKLGDDADAVIANPVTYGKFTNQGVTEPNGTSGYGINKITLSRVKGLPTVRFAGGLDLVQVLYAREYTHVVYERAVTGSAKMGYQADANGILTFRDPKYLFDPSSNAAKTGPLSYGIKGAGTVEFEATDTLYGDETTYDLSAAYTGWLTGDWVTVATRQQLSALKSATALFAGPSMHASFRDKSCSLERLSIAADGQTASGQFQYLFGGWLSGVTNRCAAIFVQFQQNGEDIQMRATAARCFGGNSTPAADAVAKYGMDFTNIGASTPLSTDGTDGYYGVHRPTLNFEYQIPVKLVTMGRYQGIRAMAGSSSVPGCKAQLIIKGTDNTKMRYLPAAGNGHVLPYTDGLLRVQNGGDVVHQMSGRTSTSTMWVDDRALIYIEQGGVFRQQANWGMGVMQRVDIAGGEYRVRDIASVTSGQCAFNLLTFSGATLLHSANDGDFVCAGATNGVVNAIWNVRGTAASTCDIALRLWTASSGGTMTFAVNDVASGSDFVMNGAVDVNPQFPNVTVYKTGSGMMQLNASYNLSGRPTLLTDGMWLLNGSLLTSASDPYTIDGGTLAVADGTANSMGVLTVGAAGGGITLGAGATLTFADSSAATWEAGERVVITGFEPKAIRFGATKNALTPVQLGRFRTSEGRSLNLGIDGYLYYRGTALILR